MIVLDVNVLLYAYDASDPRHSAASRWLERLIGGDDDVGLSVSTILSFIRIVTDPRVYDVPRTISDALTLVEEWLARPNVRLIQPTPGHWKTLRDLCVRSRARGPLVMDAHLAVLALEHGGSIATADRDFRRFDGLRVVDPTNS